MRKLNGHYAVLIPSIGIIIFLIMYLTAAFLYPGGSKTDHATVGFSLTRNYWCDLFDTVTYSGAVNPARPVAIAAMMIICFSLGCLYYIIPRLFAVPNRIQRVIQWTGVVSMAVAFFIFTGFHEAVINFGGLLGGIALVLTLVELYRARLKLLWGAGVFCVFLSGLNFFVYKTGTWFSLLAGIQKIAFLAYCGWGALLNWAIYRRSLNQDRHDA